jgi:hypothetical protein
VPGAVAKAAPDAVAEAAPDAVAEAARGAVAEAARGAAAGAARGDSAGALRAASRCSGAPRCGGNANRRSSTIARPAYSSGASGSSARPCSAML